MFGAPAAADGRPTYAPPVDAPIVDPFRPPPSPWLPGNRGIEYGTVPGTPVGAIGPGRVAFAGAVAGRLVVTVQHPDGLRSSYVGLAVVRVAVGDQVRGGQPVGLSAARLHLGVRRGPTYLDPASLWGRGVGGGHVTLVPGGPRARPDPPPTPAPTQVAGPAARSQAVTAGGRGHRRVVRLAGRVAGALRRTLLLGAGRSGR